MKKKILVLVLLGCVAVFSAVSGSTQAPNKKCDPVKIGAQSQAVPQFIVPGTVPGYEAILLQSSLPGPRGVGVFPQGRDVLFNTENDDSLYRYKSGTLSHVLTASATLQASRCRGGYVVGDDIGHIFRLKDGSGLVSLMAPVPGFISALDVDPANGDIYFIAQGTVLFRLPKGKQFAVGLGSLPNESWGIAVRSNHLFITQFDTGLIYKMPKKGGPLTIAFTGLVGPTDLVFNKEGDLFIAEFNGGSIAYIPCTFSSIKRIAFGFVNPYYLGLDKNRNIYFSDYGSDELWLIKKR